MPSAYVSLLTHIVFSTKERQRFLDKRFRDPLFAVMGGIVNALGATPLEIGGVEDHIHMLLGMKPTQRVAYLVRDVKVEASKWMHYEANLSAFGWQDGYGAFSVSSSAEKSVREYIRNQEEHHATRSFEAEFMTLLKRHGVAFDPRYLF